MTRHFRWFAVAITGLLSACAYHLQSPIADFDSRLAEPPVPVGRYCNLGDEDKLEPDCAVLEWHADTRMFKMQNEGGEEPPTLFSLAGLSDGLVAAEVVSDEMPYPYQIYLFVHTEDAFAFLPMAEDEDAMALAAQYPGVEMAGEQDGIYVSGEAEAVREFLDACGRLALGKARAEDEDVDVAVYAPDATVSATPEQLKARERLLALAERLADEAPELETVE